MKVFGLTGGIASGKSTIANYFASLGVPIVDADIAAREVVLPPSPAYQAIVSHFGQDILLPDGTLNRGMLRNIIFTHPPEKQWLESLLHPLIREWMREAIEKAQGPYVIAVIPLLIETLPNPLIDGIIVVDVDISEQVKRISLRDNCSKQQAKAALAAQTDRDTRLNHADFIIENNRPFTEVRPDLDALHAQLLQQGQS